MARADAWNLLTEYVASESLRKHCLAVEAAMRAYARKYGEDVEKWGVVGLLHDFDYEKWPDEHPMKGSTILEERGYPEDIRRAILGHATFSAVPRDTQMAKCLFAVDELCGMVMATAYIRPAHFEGMSVKSVQKNLKKKEFARGIHREEITQGIAELGVPEEEHIQLVIDAMREIQKDLGFE
jgi:putative nucleotidyltransferase with HDIG domain